MSQCEKTENQAEQNESHAVAGIEAHPAPPHCCGFRDDRGNLAHADLQCGVAGRELRAPERVDEMDDSESKGDARTKNHQNFGVQDALLLCAHPSYFGGNPTCTSPNLISDLLGLIGTSMGPVAERPRLYS